MTCDPGSMSAGKLSKKNKQYLNKLNQNSVQLDWLLLRGHNANTLYDTNKVVTKGNMLLKISVVLCSVLTSYFYLLYLHFLGVLFLM